MDSTTIESDVCAFFFDEEARRAGPGLQGSNITKINPN